MDVFTALENGPHPEMRFEPFFPLLFLPLDYQKGELVSATADITQDVFNHLRLYAFKNIETDHDISRPRNSIFTWYCRVILPNGKWKAGSQSPLAATVVKNRTRVQSLGEI